MELQLKLTEKDYRGIAERRANRYVWKGYRHLLLIGFLGVFIGLSPYLLTPDSYHYTTSQLIAIIGVFLIMVAIMFVYAGRVSRVENSILAKWGIKNKKGAKWASE